MYKLYRRVLIEFFSILINAFFRLDKALDTLCWQIERHMLFIINGFTHKKKNASNRKPGKLIIRIEDFEISIAYYYQYGIKYLSYYDIGELYQKLVNALKTVKYLNKTSSAAALHKESIYIGELMVNLFVFKDEEDLILHKDSLPVFMEYLSMAFENRNYNSLKKKNDEKKSKDFKTETEYDFQISNMVSLDRHSYKVPAKNCQTVEKNCKADEMKKYEKIIELDGPAIACAASPEEDLLAVISQVGNGEYAMNIFGGQNSEIKRSLKLGKRVPKGCALSNRAETICIYYNERINFYENGNLVPMVVELNRRNVISVVFSVVSDSFVVYSKEESGIKLYVELRKKNDLGVSVVIGSEFLYERNRSLDIFFSYGGRYMGILNSRSVTVIDIATQNKIFTFIDKECDRLECSYFTGGMKLRLISLKTIYDRAAKVKQNIVYSKLLDPEKKEIISKIKINPDEYALFIKSYKPDKCVYINERDAVLCPCEYGKILLIDMSTLKIVDDYQGHTDEVKNIVLMSGGSNFLSCSCDCTSRVWHVSPARKLKENDFKCGHEKFGGAVDMYFLPYKDEIIEFIGGGVKKICLDAGGIIISETIESHEKSFEKFEIHSPDKMLYVINKYGKMMLWKKDSKKMVEVLAKYKCARSFKFSRDEKFFIVSTFSGNVVVDIDRAFDYANFGTKSWPPPIVHGSHAALNSAGERYFLEYVGEGTGVAVRERVTPILTFDRLKPVNEIHHKINGFHEAVNRWNTLDSRLYSISGRTIAFYEGEGRFDFFDCYTGASLYSFNTADKSILRFRLCGQGRYLLIKPGHDEKKAIARLKLYEITSNKLITDFSTESGISNFNASHDAYKIAVCDDLGRTTILFPFVNQIK